MKLYKEFFRYVIPSMFAFALSGLYGIVDGFFLGNEMGDSALAAINIAYPITAFMQALGTGVGMGGAVLYTILKAQQKEKEKAECLAVTLKLLAVLGVLLTPVFVLGNGFFLKLLGASGEILSLGKEYIRWIALGTLFQLLGTGLVPFMRNIGGAMIPMIAMVFGSVLNIGFDYLFIWVFPFGMTGAAIASVMGQVGAFLVSIVYLIRKKERICWKSQKESYLKKILLIGCSPFGLSFAPNLTLILVNLNAITYGGDFAIKAYAPISYITFTIMMLLQGVSDGCQPLVSFYYGKGEVKITRKIYILSRNFSLLLGILCFLILMLWAKPAVGFFGTSEAVTHYVVEILPLFLLGMVFAGLSRSVISFLYASEQNRKAYVMIYGENMVLFVLLLFLPRLFGINGTWLSIMISQILIALLGQIMVKEGVIAKTILSRMGVEKQVFKP